MRLFYLKFSFLFFFSCLIGVNALVAMTPPISVFDDIVKDKVKDKTNPIKSRLEKGGKNDGSKKDDALPLTSKNKRKSSVLSENFKKENLREKIEVFSILSKKGVQPISTTLASKPVLGPDPFRFSISSSKDSVKIGEEFELTVTVDWVDFGVNNGVKFLPEWYKFVLKVVMPKGFVQIGGDYVDYCTKTVDAQNPQVAFKIKGVLEYVSEDATFKVLRGFEGANDAAEFILKEEKKIILKGLSNNLRSARGGPTLCFDGSYHCIDGDTTRINNTIVYNKYKYYDNFSPIIVSTKISQLIRDCNSSIGNYYVYLDNSFRITPQYIGQNPFTTQDFKVDYSDILPVTKTFTYGTDANHNLTIRYGLGNGCLVKIDTISIIHQKCSGEIGAALGSIQASATNPISLGQTLNLTSVYKDPSGAVSALPVGATLSWYKGNTLLTNTSIPNVTGYNAGAYTAKISIGANCEVNSTVNVILPCTTLNTPRIIGNRFSANGCNQIGDTTYIASGQTINLVNKATCAGITQWSNGAIGRNINVYPTISTTYTAVCKDSSCITSQSNRIVLIISTDCNKIQIGRPSLYYDNNNVINLGDSLTLSINGNCLANNSITEWTDGTTSILAGKKVAPTQNKKFYVRCKNGSCISPYDTLRVFVKCGSVATPTLTYYNDGSSTFPIHYAQANGCTGTVSWFNNNTYVAQGNRFLLSDYPGQNLKYPKAICSVNGCSSDFSAQFNPSIIPLDPKQDYSGTLNGALNKTPNGNFYSFKCGESVIVNATGCRNDKPKSIYLLTPNEVTSNGLGKARIYTFEGASIEVPIPINSGFNVNSSQMFLECYANNNPNPTWIPISYYIEASRDNPYKVPIKATNNTICAGGTSVLYAENCGGSVQWQNRITTGSWANNATGDTISVSPPANTFYRAKCMSAQCPNNPWSDSLSINIDALINAPARPVIVGDTLINYSLDDPFNSTGAAIRASCNGSIVWSTGQEGDLVYVRPAVTTSYTARCSSNGCLSQPSKPVVVNICAGTAPTITLSKDTVNWCNGSPFLNIIVSGCRNSYISTYIYDGAGSLISGQSGGVNADSVIQAYISSSIKIRAKCIPISGNGCPSRLSEYKTVNYIGPPTPLIKSNARPTDGVPIFCEGEQPIILRIENCPGIVKWYANNSYLSSGNTYTLPNAIFAPGETVITSGASATCTVDNCESTKGYYSLYILKPPTPTISTTSTNQICSGASVTLTATGCYGLVMWNGVNGGETMTINPVRDTTFTATCLYSYYGCESPNSNTLSFTIKPTPTQLTISPTTLTICPGDTATLTTSACVGYVQWSNGVNGQVLKVVPSATTSYTAKCINSCAVAGPNSSPTNVTIEPLTKPVISALKSLLCSNGIHQDGTITLTATGCAYTVQWSNGLMGNSVTFPTSVTKKFSAVCVRNTCISPPADSLQITVLSIPLPPSITVSNRYKCVGIVRTDNVTAQGYNGGLQWYANGTLLTDTTKVISVSPTVTTKYYTTSTNICGTSNASPMDSIVIVPIPTITSIALLNKSTPLVCSNNANDKLQIQANGCVGTVEWTGGELTGQNVTGTTVIVKPTALTTYSARCNDRGCLSIYRDFQGNIFTERPLAMTVIGSPISPGQTATLKATRGYAQYRWFTSTNLTTPFKTTTDSSILVNPTLQTSYFVKCTGYCSELSTQNQLQTVLIDLPPVPTITAPVVSICEGTVVNVQLTATGCNSGTILWDNGETNSTRMVTPLFTTTYSAKCITTNGYVGIAGTKTIIVNTSPIIKTYPVSVKVGEAVKLAVDVTPTGTYTYNWTGPSSFTSTTQNPQVTASAVKLTHQGVYTIKIGGAASICTAIATTKVSIIDTQCGCDDCATLVTTNPSINPTVAIVGKNYVVENTYLEPVSTIPTTAIALMQTISYFDGLGRPIQKTAVKAGPNKEDIVSTMEYDGFGREAIKRLPFPVSTTTSNSGQLIANPIDFIKNHYGQDPAKQADKDFAFAQTTFETSPLNRILQQGSPGALWQPTTDATVATNHTVRMGYFANSKNGTGTDIESRLRDNIKIFTFPSVATTMETQSLSVNYYEPNQLMVNISTDENGNKMSESKDKDGRVVCKRVQNVTPSGATQIVETNYIYDDLGQLRFVLQPMASATLVLTTLNNVTTSITITPLNTAATTNISELVFAYNYDTRLRPIEKKVPGMVKTEMVYDKRDRLVYSIDGWGRVLTATTGRSKGVYARYDELNRVIESGYYTVLANQTCGVAPAPVYNSSTSPRAFVQCKFDGMLNTTAYDFLATVPVLDKPAYLNNVYDAYPGTEANSFVAGDAYGQLSTTNVKGMLVKSIDKVLYNNGVSSTANILNPNITTLMFYDNLGRSIQTVTLNHTNKTDVASSLLDFVGRVTFSKSKTNYTWRPTSGSTVALPTIVVENKTTYDYGGRVASICQINDGIDGQTWEPVVRNSYSKIGELLGKKMGCDIQNVDYQYNIRSWLTKINDPANLAGNNRDLFGLNLTYNDGTQFNGNITKLEWNTLSKLDNVAVPKGLQQYTYTYDKMNRLLNANFSSGVTALNALGISVSMISTDNTKSYDVNGNIGFMKRTVNSVLQDQLTYTYEGTSQLSNRLLKIDDAGNKTNANYFLDVTNATDYTYDANGNMKTDVNKGITGSGNGITYTHTNLPTLIAVGGTNAGKMRYYYTFTGKKVRTEVYAGTSSTFTDAKTIEYVNGLAFKGGALEFVPTAEGRALSAKYVWSNTTTATALLPPVAPANQYRYEYQLKDHLGDLRVSCRCGDPKRNAAGDMIAGLEPTMAVQENHYDPWGLGFADAASNTQKPPKNTDRFQYNGKEKVSDLGLGLYDYGARHYDPAMGRWSSVDPLAEQMRKHSTYNYAFDNPVRFIDPDGMAPDDYYIRNNGEIVVKKTEGQTDRFFVESSQRVDKKNNITIRNYKFVTEATRNDGDLIALPSSLDTPNLHFNYTGSAEENYVSAPAFAGIIGALNQSKCCDVSLNHWSNSDGSSPSPSTSHKEGTVGDIRPLREDQTGNTVLTTDSQFDRDRNATLIGNFKKYGWTSVLSEKNPNDDYITPGTTNYSGYRDKAGHWHPVRHNNHFHIQRFDPNLIDYKPYILPKK